MTSTKPWRRDATPLTDAEMNAVLEDVREHLAGLPVKCDATIRRRDGRCVARVSYPSETERGNRAGETEYTARVLRRLKCGIGGLTASSMRDDMIKHAAPREEITDAT